MHQAGDNRVDVASLKAGIVSDLLKESQREVAEGNQTIEKLRQELAARRAWMAQTADIARELQAQYPYLDHIAIGSGPESDADGKSLQEIALLSATSPKTLPPEEQQRMKAWFKVRTKAKATAVRLLIEGPIRPGRRRA